MNLLRNVGWIKKILISCAILLWVGMTHATMDDLASVNGEGAHAPPNIGNFALPAPQQPAPLISFGQTLIGRNHLQLEIDSFAPFPGKGGFQNLNTSMIFGVSDATAIYFNYPIQSSDTIRLTRVTALQDATLQLEHAVYTAGTSSYQDQASLVGFVSLPLTTIDPTRQFPIGYGSPAYFLGATYNRTTIDWLFFVSDGAFLTTASDHIQLGSQGIYQAGIGRNIISETNRYILMGLLEFDGQYTTKDKVLGHRLVNTGGNTIGMTPSLWFSTRHLIMQLGVGFPIVQNLNGKQKKTDYYVAASLSWTIA